MSDHDVRMIILSTDDLDESIQFRAGLGIFGKCGRLDRFDQLLLASQKRFDLLTLFLQFLEQQIIGRETGFAEEGPNLVQQSLQFSLTLQGLSHVVLLQCIGHVVELYCSIGRLPSLLR